MLIAQMTDLHLRPPGRNAYRVAETNMLTERAFEALAALQPRPNVLLITGDMTDCGLDTEYALLRKLLLRLPMPVFMVPGNHDRREKLKTAFVDWPEILADPDYVQFVIDDFSVRLIGLDTVVPGASEGELCDARLDFLERTLAEAPTRPTVIFMHHPPFDCGILHMDRIRLLRGADRLAQIVRQHGHVERILCGHHHRPIEALFGGTIASIAPSVAHQVAFDLREDHDGGLVLEPPAFRLHRYRPETGIVSHMVYVDRYAGPFPFILDPDYPGQP